MWAYATYANNAEVVRSTDDGAGWQKVFPNWPQTPTSLVVSGAFFLNADDAWAVTDRQWPAPPGVTTVWRTTDGGATWQKGTSFPSPLPETDYPPVVYQLAFTDAGRGYAVSALGEQSRAYGLWAISDGGTTWHRLSTSGSARPTWRT
ncbi:MAG: WD40/YVTN/BNR-like repeat-containing protein [Acidimicrobiales bacterium]